MKHKGLADDETSKAHLVLWRCTKRFKPSPSTRDEKQLLVLKFFQQIGAIDALGANTSGNEFEKALSEISYISAAMISKRDYF